MKLNNLRIERETYGERKGQLRGKVGFSGPIGEISIIITDEQMDRILQVCADSLAETAREAGSLMTSELIEQTTPALTQE